MIRLVVGASGRRPLGYGIDKPNRSPFCRATACINCHNHRAIKTR